MDAKDFDELAGRIDAIGQALLRLAAELEMQGVIDGSRVSAAWVSVAERRTEATAAHRSAHKTLRQMAQMLDEARSHHRESVRQARLADPSLLDRAAQQSRLQ